VIRPALIDNKFLKMTAPRFTRDRRKSLRVQRRWDGSLNGVWKLMQGQGEESRSARGGSREVGISLSATLLLILCLGCSTTTETDARDETFTVADVRSLTLGMSQEEVESVAGKPTRVVGESWIYATTRNPSAVVVSFKEGVSSFVNIEFVPRVKLSKFLTRSTDLVSMRVITNDHTSSWVPAVGIPDLGEFYELTPDFCIMSISRTKPWESEELKDLDEVLEEIGGWSKVNGKTVKRPPSC
jgi:hypothetical protein